MRVDQFRIIAQVGDQPPSSDCQAATAGQRRNLPQALCFLSPSPVRSLQVGQGGYGSVYLARKADTGQVCALKKMKKTTLAKMDEVKHVLIERDILTATKSPWLVKLLYAFQDRDHIYLAMVSQQFPKDLEV